MPKWVATWTSPSDSWRKRPRFKRNYRGRYFQAARHASRCLILELASYHFTFRSSQSHQQCHELASIVYSLWSIKLYFSLSQVSLSLATRHCIRCCHYHCPFTITITCTPRLLQTKQRILSDRNIQTSLGLLPTQDEAPVPGPSTF
jgi:hypothetical protein